MPLDLTDDQLAALRSILDAAPDATPEAPTAIDATVADALASTTVPATDTLASVTTPIDPAAGLTPTEPTEPAAPSSPAIAVRDVVSQTTTVGWMHKPITRYGIVVRIEDDPVIVGTDTSGSSPVDVMATHVDVAWFGADGLTTVPLDELNPID